MNETGWNYETWRMLMDRNAKYSIDKVAFDGQERVMGLIIGRG